MPFIDGDLAGDDRRSAAVAFFENFEQVVTSGAIERLEPPVVEDEQLHTAERSLDARIATVAAGEREIYLYFDKLLSQSPPERDLALIALSAFVDRAVIERLILAGDAENRLTSAVMIALLCFLLALFASPFKSKSLLEAENAALRHQLIVVQRKMHGRIRLTNGDRLFLVQLYRAFPSVLNAITIIRPATVVRWHRGGFRRYWRWKSRSLGAGHKSTRTCAR